MSFQRDLFLPFHLVDAAGILFFGHAFTLAHQIFECFIIEHLHIPWSSWFQHCEWIVPIKHTEASYQYPLFAGRLCTVELHIQEIRTSSFMVHYTFSQEGRPCCHVKTLHIFCDRSTGAKRPIPETISPLLEASVKSSPAVLF